MIGGILIDDLENGLKLFKRSLIVNDKKDIRECKYDLTVTEIDDTTHYVTLTDDGVRQLLEDSNFNETTVELIVCEVNRREQEQLDSVLKYLRLEKELGSKVVFTILQDLNISTDTKMLQTSFNLPLSVLFKTLLDQGYRLVNMKTLKPVSEVDTDEYGNYLFVNKKNEGLLSVFIELNEEGS